MNIVRWGMIGCGDVTEVKSGPAFSKIEGSELLAVTSRTAAKARDYAERHGVPRWYDDAEEIFADPDVNAIYVATPPDSHAEYTIRAARAGKVVYVEKPMARSRAECETMIEACRAAGVRLYAAYYRRCLPKFLKVRELVQSGAIGQVRFVSVMFRRPAEPPDFEKDNLPWRVFPDRAGGGYFVDLAPHQLDFLDYVFGPAGSVRGYAANQAGLYPAEDIVCAQWTFEGGIVANGLWCFTASEHSQIDQTEIVGSEGRIVYATFGAGPVRLENGDGIQEFDSPVPENIQQPLIQSIVDELRGEGTCPSTAETAARTDWVIDEILGRAG